MMKVEYQVGENVFSDGDPKENYLSAKRAAARNIAAKCAVRNTDKEGKWSEWRHIVLRAPSVKPPEKQKLVALPLPKKKNVRP